MVISKIRYRDLLGKIGAGITVLDREFRIKWINRSQAQWVGSLARICGRHCYEVFEHRKHICRGCPTIQVFKTGKIHEANRIGYTQDGKKHYYHLTVSPLKNGQGNAVSFVVELIQDITEQRIYQRRKEKIVRKLELMYRRISSSNKKLFNNLHKLKDIVGTLSKSKKIMQKKYHQKSRAVVSLRDELADIFKVNRTLNSTLDSDKVSSLITRYTCELMHTDACVLRLFDKNRNMLFITANHGISQPLASKLSEVKVGESICGRVAKTRKPVAVDNIYKEPAIKHKGIIKKEGFKSMLCVPVEFHGSILGVISAYSRKIKHFTKDQVELLSIFAAQVAVAVHESRYAQDIQRNYFDTIHALVLAIEARDPFARGHTERVTKYALEVARSLRFSRQEMEILRYASEVHDIGKISIPDFVLNKPGKLTPAERAIIELHPVKGEEMLEPLSFLKGGLPIVRHHHERYDGTGYPDGLEKDRIPILARILACADSFDAMTSDRPYRSRKLTIQEALTEIKNNAGSQFDPQIARLFIKKIPSCVPPLKLT